MSEFAGAAGAPLPPGLGFASDSLLVARALEAIRTAPRSTPELARQVFGLTSGPAGIAARLVYDLLGTDRRVAVDGSGVWRVAVAPETAVRTPLEEVRFAVVDVETTGSTPSRGDRIIEIAIVEVLGGRVVNDFCTLINPGIGISPWITRLTGIFDDLVDDAPRFADVSDHVRELLGGRIFVAHNVGFDWRFVAEELRRSRAVMPTGPRLCTVRLAKFAVPGLRRRGLDSVARYYDVEIHGRHRAGGDARATAEVLIRMLDEAGRRGVCTWEDLQDRVAPGSPRRTRGGRKTR
jgi:DNA polymerase III epsilon subunit family exonuclease